MSLGKRIKAARERLVPRPTQGKLGELLGVTDKAVSGWERDAAIPEHAKLSELRRILCVTYAWLMEGGDTPPPAVDDPEFLMEQRNINLLRKEQRRVA